MATSGPAHCGLVFQCGPIKNLDLLVFFQNIICVLPNMVQAFRYGELKDEEFSPLAMFCHF